MNGNLQTDDEILVTPEHISNNQPTETEIKSDNVNVENNQDLTLFEGPTQENLETKPEVEMVPENTEPKPEPETLTENIEPSPIINAINENNVFEINTTTSDTTVNNNLDQTESSVENLPQEEQVISSVSEVKTPLGNNKDLITSIIMLALFTSNYLYIGPKYILVGITYILRFVNSFLNKVIPANILGHVSVIILLSFYAISLVLVLYFLYAVITRGKGLIGIRDVLKKIVIYCIFITMILYFAEIFTHFRIFEAYMRAITLNGKLAIRFLSQLGFIY